MRPTLLQIAILLAVVGASSGARAQRGIDEHLFRPAVDSYGIFSVERAETAPAWSIGLSLYTDFAGSPLTVNMTDPANGMPRRQTLIDWQLVTNLGITLGLRNWLEAVLIMPASAQGFDSAYGLNGDPSDPKITRTGFYLADQRTNVPPPNAGPLDMSLGLKARLLRTGPFGMALVAVGTLPFGDGSAFLGDTGFTFRPQVIADLSFRRISFAVNLGAITRQTTVVLDPYQVAAHAPQPRVLLAVGHELTWAAGASFRATRWLNLNATIYGYDPLGLGPNSADHTADLLAGVQFLPTSQVAISVGAGAGVMPSAVRHDLYRTFLGITWAPAHSEGRRASGALGNDADRDDDGDGIPNSIDRCPKEPEDRDGFEDDDGCPDPDNDHDGIPDSKDRCPNEAEDFDGFEDSDGCPDLDNDGDGIPDAVDRCPNEPETFNGIDDQDGCPDSGSGVIAGEARLEISEVISFEAGKSSLSRRDETELNRIADRLLGSRKVRRVRIEGHADNREASKRALALSQARADAVRNYLQKRGVPADRLQSVGYGDARPLDSGNSAEARARNRRVEFIVVEQ